MRHEAVGNVLQLLQLCGGGGGGGHGTRAGAMLCKSMI